MHAQHIRCVVVLNTGVIALTRPESTVTVLAAGIRTRSIIIRCVTPLTFPTLRHDRPVTVSLNVKVTTGIAAGRTRRVVHPGGPRARRVEGAVLVRR